MREIRDRVRAEPLAPSGHEELAHEARVSQSELQTTADRLARLETHSRTTLRAWDKLPPLTSKRSGLFARIELWFKRQMRRATHWYAWEQINFNAAVKDTLQDVTAILSHQESEMTNLRSQLAAATNMKAQLASHLSSYEASLRGLERSFASLDQKFANLEDKFAALPASETPALHDEVQAIRALLADLRGTFDESLARLRDEQHARIEQLQDEHRVSFKQLSLEINENALKARRRDAG
jgi:predicted nuclease with TOPRIM domain